MLTGQSMLSLHSKNIMKMWDIIVLDIFFVFIDNLDESLISFKKNSYHRSCKISCKFPQQDLWHLQHMVVHELPRNSSLNHRSRFVPIFHSLDKVKHIRWGDYRRTNLKWFYFIYEFKRALILGFSGTTLY